MGEGKLISLLGKAVPVPGLGNTDLEEPAGGYRTGQVIALYSSFNCP